MINNYMKYLSIIFVICSSCVFASPLTKKELKNFLNKNIANCNLECHFTYLEYKDEFEACNCNDEILYYNFMLGKQKAYCECLEFID